MNQPDNEIITLDEVAVYLKAGKKTVYTTEEAEKKGVGKRTPGARHAST